jgi:ribonucleoside-diphosphate reductase alpha subunit
MDYLKFSNEEVEVTKELLKEILCDNVDEIKENIDLENLVEQAYNSSKKYMTLNMIYYFLSDMCANKISYHSDYNKLASRLSVKRLHTCTTDNFLEATEELFNNIDQNNRKYPLVKEEYYNVVKKYHKEIQEMIDFNRDYYFDYFSIRTFERSYLYRVYSNNSKSYYQNDKNGKIVERPQYLIMRVAIAIHEDNLEEVKTTYDLISNKYFTHATPTLFNAGSGRSQYSSCFLLDMQDDLGKIMDTQKYIAQISKYAGGIGVDLTSIRGAGSIIRSTNGKSEGIIPLCILLGKLSRYANQSGKRNGSIACFVKDTEVFTTNAGVKKIQDVEIGDLVITHKNRVKPVVQVHKNPIEGRKIYKLEVEKNKDIYVTGNHRFMSFYTKKYKSNKLSLGWNSIEELKNIMDNKKTTRQACYISIPKSTNIKDTNDYKINVIDYEDIILVDTINKLEEVNDNEIISISETIDNKGYKKIGKSKPVNKIWNISEDFANLIGIWLGDGHIRKSKTGGKILGIGFTIHKDNKNEIDFITNVSKLIFGYNVTSYTTRNVVHLTINSRIVGLIFNNLFGEYFNGKKLPTMVFSWPKKLIDNLIAGLVTTDGHIYVNKNGITGISLSMSNENLMNQLYHLCRNNGIDVSLKKCKIQKGQTCESYKMCIPLRKEIIEKTHKLYSDDRINKCIQQSENINEDNVYLKILNITETDRNDEYVYTLGVEEDHSYTVEGLIAENCYLQPWHTDIFEFCELRKNTGDDNVRARDLFLALWVNDLFMERVEKDEMWSLFCPDECRDLILAYGEDFNERYINYEKEKKYRKQVKARDLFNHIMKCQIETGALYFLYKDHVNRKSNQKNIGAIRCSNLCAEIVEYTDENEIAVCNLASICLPRFINRETKEYDFEKLKEVARVITRNLNKIIDQNFYPVEQARYSNLRHRPIGIGVQGLADCYNIMKYQFDSEEAMKLNKQIFETIYYATLLESCELAKKNGPYTTFSGSPFSEGKLQYHLWGLEEKELIQDYDWASLIEDIKKYGTRNSLLTALMPTASTAQIMGNSESIEPYLSNIFLRSTLAGEFIVVNDNLQQDLIKLGLWSDDMRKLLIINNGSIQNIDIIPQEIKNIYKTAFETKQKALIRQAADRGCFVDQTQSMNLFMAKPNFDVLRSCHFTSWKYGLKTGMYYLRTQAAVNPINFGIDVDDIMRLTGKNASDILFVKEQEQEEEEKKEEDEPVIMCKFKPGMKLEDCEMCSA